MKKKIVEEKHEETAKINTPFLEMKDTEMDALLLELYYSAPWQAILKFDRKQHAHVTSVLASVDPFKDPTMAARAQGNGIGLFALESKVNNLVEKNK